eukprot:PhM_4_TR18420/c4_g1_i3/m.85177
MDAIVALQCRVHNPRALSSNPSLHHGGLALARCHHPRRCLGASSLDAPPRPGTHRRVGCKADRHGAIEGNRQLCLRSPNLGVAMGGPGCDERRLPWMTSSEFLVAVLFRLGRDIFPADGSVKCRMCAAPLDAKGDHALTCLARGARTIVHHRIVEEFFALASAARLWPRKEDGN